MRVFALAISQLSTNSRATQLKTVTNLVAYNFLFNLSTKGGNEGDVDWGSESTWSSGLTKEHFDGEVVGQKVDNTDDNVSGSVGGGAAAIGSSYEDDLQNIRKLAAAASRKDGEFASKWKDRMRETNVLMKQVLEPGARGAYLKDSEKAEMYKLHKENPEVYTVEKLRKTTGL
ncbi:hypothetical protein HanOQP8_Chr05g0177781 [Helianthus annuus]|nr:hypothetical protein HanIR_Chr05g0218031 [Helianthus annuus]KAJ0746453.1 hypothetical protein HanOQP8_Chr05g0177781 [Helianthus annuus]KAJ0749460.1 hypothetical protein HanLR1_Chr05g0170121 [Helianthus annuus]KAJ0921714.1 hypothetical protein HanPSC8_Chr05g0194821 [Helianthus annuus]